MSPATPNRAQVIAVCRQVRGSRTRAASPVRVDHSMAAKISRTCGISTAAGTSPLNRVTTGSRAGTHSRVSSPSPGPGRDRPMR